MLNAQTAFFYIKCLNIFYKQEKDEASARSLCTLNGVFRAIVTALDKTVLLKAHGQLLSVNGCLHCPTMSSVSLF